MSERPDYWTLTSEEFTRLKTQMSLLADKTLIPLIPYRFSKIESQREWLGYTVKRKEHNVLTFVAFSLQRETPRDYELVLRQWNTKNPSETSMDIYRRNFTSMDEFEVTFDKELETIIDKIKLLK